MPRDVQSNRVSASARDAETLKSFEEAPTDGGARPRFPALFFTCALSVQFWTDRVATTPRRRSAGRLADPAAAAFRRWLSGPRCEAAHSCGLINMAICPPAAHLCGPPYVGLPG